MKISLDDKKVKWLLPQNKGIVEVNRQSRRWVEINDKQHNRI